MQQLVLEEQGRFAWREADEPEPPVGGGARVRPVVVTLCDLDRPIADGRFPLPTPIPFGHEFVGEVVDVGPDVRSVQPGDLVVVPFQISDGTCGRCRRGLSANCEAVPARSQYGFGEVGGPWGGAFADLVGVPYADAMLVPVPAGVDPVALAAAGDNLSDGYRCVVPHLAERPGGRVLVLGGIGSVPLYAAMFATAADAAVVDYVDPDPTRRSIAEQVGARPLEAVPERTRYDVCVDGTLFEPDGLSTAVQALDVGGACAIATIYLTPPSLPQFELYMKGGELHTGRVHARALAPEVVAAVAAGSVDPTIVTAGERLDWASAPDTILTAGVKPVYVRS